MSNATFETNIAVDLPDYPAAAVTFTNVAFFISGNSEVFPGKQYTLTLDVNGQGTQGLPCPDNTGVTAVNWRINLPSKESGTFAIAYDAATQQLSDILAAGSTTTDPDNIIAALAGKIGLVSPAVAGNFPAQLADGSLEDSGFSGTSFDVAGAAAAVAGDLTTHTGDATIHFTQAAISITPSQAGAEAALGNPAANGDILSSTTTGTRSWVTVEDKLEHIVVAASDETSDLTAGTAKVTFAMPYAMTLTAVKANVNNAPTGSAIVVDINEAGTSVLSTKITIDATTTSSLAAATQPVISDSALANDAVITIDIDAVGSTAAGKGLKITLFGARV